MLRELLINEPLNQKLRREYISTRGESLREPDEQAARFGTAAVYCLWGAAGGIVGGALVGAICISASVIGGIVFGSVVAFVLSKRK
jgi:hypothetical protein